MNLLEKAVTRAWERKLKKYREEAVRIKKEHDEEFQKHLPHIERCYAKAYYWHGTGRYQYKHGDSTRYEALDTSKHVDVLDSIIAGGGLTPHHDPWMLSDGGYAQTISVAPVRMHSRVYARVHQYEKNRLIYELGDIKFWIRFYLSALAVAVMEQPLRGMGELERIFFTTSARTNLQRWANVLHKKKKGRAVKLVDIWQGNHLYSDIPENYPMLFGITRGDIEFISSPLAVIDRVEKRARATIPYTNFTHVEVPLDKVAETKKFLESRGVELEVLPFEFGDLYCSHLSLHRLAYV
jgi:hypothetical protein